MEHPNTEIREKQKKFLENCPKEKKASVAQMFRLGNAALVYHQKANETTEADLKKYFHEWLEGLPENIALDMRNKGFEGCKTVLPFTRYVNERCDIGMTDWMKENLSEEDFKYWDSYREEIE